MKSKMKKLEGVARQLEITLSGERVKEVLEEVLEDIRKDAAIPGFRKGNAPLDMIRQKYYNDALDEVKKRLIPEAYQAALDEHKLEPVSYPDLFDIVMNADSSIAFKAKLDVKPDLKLSAYKGMKLTTSKISVSDEEVEKALSSIRNIHAEFVKVERCVQKGDFSICDVETSMDGKPMGKKRENMWIEANKENSLLGLGEDLCGMNNGEKKTIETVMPENYPDKRYAGKKVSFNVEVKEVREKKLPELDAKLAEKTGRTSIEDLKKDLHSGILEGKEEENRSGLKRQVVENLLKKNPFDVPESMTRRQLEVLVQRAEDDLAKKGVAKETIESNRDKLKTSLAEQARDKVRIYFILDEIAKKENIAVTEEEIDKWLLSVSEHYNQKFEDVKKYYDDHDLLGGIEEQIAEEKTLDFIISEAEIAVK